MKKRDRKGVKEAVVRLEKGLADDEASRGRFEGASPAYFAAEAALEILENLLLREQQGKEEKKSLL